MAENEELDLMGKNSGRWRRLRDLIFKGAPLAEIREKTVSNICTTLRKVNEDVPLGELLRATAGENGDPEELVLASSMHRDYTQRFLREAHQGFDRSMVAEKLCTGIAESFFDQIAMEKMGCQSNPNMTELAREFAEYKLSLKGDIQRIARQWSQNPDRPPRRPPVPKEAKERRHKELLNMSLLRH